MRDYRRLRTFATADALVLSVYRETRDFPGEERYGLRSQIRRAAVSVSTNIVEGSARATTREYVHFLRVSLGSSVEIAYLLRLAGRLQLMPPGSTGELAYRYEELARQSLAQIRALEPDVKRHPERRRSSADQSAMRVIPPKASKAQKA